MRILLAVLGLTFAVLTAAEARPALVIDASNGEVIYAEDATQPWYPASLTKLLTTYIALDAVRSGRISLDTPLTYSERAGAAPPSKMGFKPGTIITLDNALKMLIVKSANDIAIVIAEGVGGNVENFVDEMNRTAQRLGMTQSRFANPNGWWTPEQTTTARDMAILARALLNDFPSQNGLFSIPALQLGKTVIRGHNGLIGRYAGADGMKTGFTCPSGFNLVASATRGNHRLIAVVLGQLSARARTEHTAEMLERGFNGGAPWSNGQHVENLAYAGGEAINMREDVCGKNRRREAADESEAENAPAPDGNPALAGLVTAPGQGKTLLLAKPVAAKPVRVFLGTNPSEPMPVETAQPQLPSVKPQAPASAATPALRGSLGTPVNLTGTAPAAPKPRGKPKPSPVEAEVQAPLPLMRPR